MCLYRVQLKIANKISSANSSAFGDKPSCDRSLGNSCINIGPGRGMAIKRNSLFPIS